MQLITAHVMSKHLSLSSFSFRAPQDSPEKAIPSRKLPFQTFLSFNPKKPLSLKTHLPIMQISKTLFVFCLISCLSMTSSQEQGATAYEMLEKFNFPRGILPQGVRSYVLNTDGSFEVYLDGECKFGVEGGYSLSYGRKITGKVSFGSLRNLKGVSVKVLFVWMGITEVSTGNGELDFYVGPLSASFPLSNFLDCPQCGCGFNCKDIVSDS
ncbi:uncharacterized protein LOC131224406 [Magnolia sinica]|uniref:uncharacterized protein LOC131224406 n=1 Tax=Magnolia sinica TaxID=86752 RepID=UPI00265A675E|nr:uncharacterized protein LOC131224406 [Magnolia sinica]